MKAKMWCLGGRSTTAMRWIAIYSKWSSCLFPPTLILFHFPSPSHLLTEPLLAHQWGSASCELAELCSLWDTFPPGGRVSCHMQGWSNTQFGARDGVKLCHQPSSQKLLQQLSLPCWTAPKWELFFIIFFYFLPFCCWHYYWRLWLLLHRRAMRPSSTPSQHPSSVFAEIPLWLSI